MHEVLTKKPEEEIFHTPRIKAVYVSYDDENGREVIRHALFRGPDSVVVIPKNKNGKIAFISQFRPSKGKYFIELPGGLIKEGESNVDAAKRELQEETGLIAKDVSVLVKGPNYLHISLSDENCDYVVANVCGKSNRQLDEMEKIEEQIIWLDEEDTFRRMKAQLFNGDPFFHEEGLFMTAHCLYALMAYWISKQG